MRQQNGHLSLEFSTSGQCNVLFIRQYGSNLCIEWTTIMLEMSGRIYWIAFLKAAKRARTFVTCPVFLFFWPAFLHFYGWKTLPPKRKQAFHISGGLWCATYVHNGSSVGVTSITAKKPNSVRSGTVTTADFTLHTTVLSLDISNFVELRTLWPVTPLQLKRDRAYADQEYDRNKSNLKAASLEALLSQRICIHKNLPALKKAVLVLSANVCWYHGIRSI